MSLKDAILLVSVLLIIWYVYNNRWMSVTSTIDGATYKVASHQRDAKAAANMLARINVGILSLMRHMKHKYVGTDISTQQRRKNRPRGARIVDLLLLRYNPDRLTENPPNPDPKETSFTIDKGEEISLCLRNTDKEIHDYNTIMFVALHELAHVGVEPFDHPDEFWNAFKFIMVEATEAGVIQPTNYKQQSQNYCGISIDYSPMYDEALETY